MKETAGYFYLQDPVGALVYIFEKSDEQSGRLRWRLDRNGNRLAYQYEEEADNLPEIVYDGDGSEGNRILYIVAVQAGSEWVTTGVMKIIRNCGVILPPGSVPKHRGFRCQVSFVGGVDANV